MLYHNNFNLILLGCTMMIVYGVTRLFVTMEDVLTPIGTNFVCRVAGERFPAGLPVNQAVFDALRRADSTAISSAVGIFTIPT